MRDSLCRPGQTVVTNGMLMYSMPPVTKNLIIINVLLYLCTLLAERYGFALSDYLGLHFFLSDYFNLAQLVTYMFMHGGFVHLFFNMFSLWMFGRMLEQVWGPKRFLTFYLVCGIGAGLVQELFYAVDYLRMSPDLAPWMLEQVHTDEAKAILHQGMNYVDPALGKLNLLVNSSTVGASGSVYGILLGFGMLFPNMPLFLMFIPFPIKAKYMVGGYAVLELLLGLSNNPGDPVAHFAHLGGMLFAFLLILYWKRKNRNNNGFYYN